MLNSGTNEVATSPSPPAGTGAAARKYPSALILADIEPTYYKEKDRSKIEKEQILFWLILDPITFGLGSIGGYILFREFVEHERLPSRDEWLPLLRQHWFAILALGISIGYFFYRLFYFLNRG